MKIRVLAIGAVAAVLGIAAAGCGGSDSAEPAPAPSEPAPAEPAPAEPAPAEPAPAEPAPAEPAPAEPAPAEPAPAEPAPAEPAPAEPAPPAGDLQSELVVLEPDVAASLDPDGSGANAAEVQEMHVNLMEPLLDYPLVDNGEGVLEPQYQVGTDGFAPRLAESWTSQANEDGTVTWTVKLRQGVQSCAGNELKADDVLYSWARGKSVSGGSPIVWFLGNVSKIFDLSPLAPDATDEDKALKDSEVRKVDDYTVEFTQSVANELFPRVLAITFMNVFDSTVMQANATDSDPWSHDFTDTKDAPGFGAYCITEYSKGNQIVLEANPNYYRGAPQFTKVTIRKVPQSANRVGAIKGGDADIITTLTPQEISDLRASENVSVLGWQNNKGLSIGLSFNFEPWNLPGNEKLRQAVAYALPYDDIIAQDYGGDALKWNGICASRYYGYVDQPIYTTDLEKAKALLAEAGFPEGKGLEQYAEGLNLFYTAERSNVLEPIANRVRTALAQIGININLNPISNAEFADRGLTKYDMPMFIQDIDRPLAPDVGYCAQLFFVSKANGGLNTPSVWDNAEFDALYAQSATTVGDARLPILQQMQELGMQALPQVPIAEPASFIATKKEVVTCWAGHPYDLLSFWHFRSGDCSAVTDPAPGGQEATDTAATDTAATDTAATDTAAATETTG